MTVRSASGERVLLIDAQGPPLPRQAPRGRDVPHALGPRRPRRPDRRGRRARRSRGRTGRAFLVLRPTLADVVLKMPRGAQVIYPKDLGAILLAADVGPGMRVLESGVGSGALSMTLLRAGASVLGYELREEFATTAQGERRRAARRGRRLHDRDPRRDRRHRRARPRPRAARHAEPLGRARGRAPSRCDPGGILLAYLPTINQTAQLRAALAAGPWGLAESSELLRRSWHVEPRSVRPDHRMVAHTGFLTTARLARGRAPPTEELSRAR